MAPPQDERYELSDAERRDLIKLIQEGKPLPEKYRFLLFDDKREVELVWNGKTREVCNVVLPFQTLEHIDEPRKETREEEELALDMGGRQAKGWTNKLIWGDNKLILSSLRAGALRHQIEEAGGLKLVYIDPPFDMGADFSMDIEVGGETFHKEPNLLEQIAYRDTWGKGADSFISMIFERLVLIKDLMADDGTIYVHIGPQVSSMLKLVLDEVFGRERFQNNIRWRRMSISGFKGKQKLPFNHESIFVYSKSDRFSFNPIFSEYTEEYKARFRYKGKDGRPFRADQNLGTATTKETVDEMRKAGLIHEGENGKLYRKQYLDELPGVPLDDVWTDVPWVTAGNQRIDYPTQKPEALLERIINMSSNEGDLVADFFCGSGTTAAVAERLGRKWLATDLGKFGVHTTRKRLIGIQRELKAAGKTFRAFEVLNLGRYERQSYLNVSSNLNSKQRAAALARKEKEYRELILKAYKAQPLDGEAFFHGKNAGRLVVIGPINLPVGRLFVEEIITEARKRQATRVDILAFEFEMGLFPAVLAEAKSKGIDIAPKTIPPEVFDKRAVEKGQVRFHEISFIEAKPIYDKKDKLRLGIQLSDYSVHYSQGLAKAIEADLKEGKSEVVCEAGKLIKVSKDKKGVVTRDVLTKKWTDWVDYWAVDFDYQSRKEIIKVPKRMGVDSDLAGTVTTDEGFLDFEDRWTGAYIFENEWQSFRTRQDRELELKTAIHVYDKPGRYVVAVKVIDIFGNDTMTLVPVTVG